MTWKYILRKVGSGLYYCGGDQRLLPKDTAQKMKFFINDFVS